MAVTLKTLKGDEIPAEHRREGLDELHAVQGGDGEPQYLESDIEAAQLLVKLSEEEREA